VEEAVVGPSLGQEAINAGLWSFVIAFMLVLAYMAFFYARAGWVANLALVVNIFFIFGVLASLGAVLTLPGIAGIVLTLGMAVDANVIIYERIKEEMRAGKGMRLAITDGYKAAYSAIIDGNVTTLLTAVVLYIFGTGPVQGFATTLIIGILSSLFTAIFISRIIFTWALDKNKHITFDLPITHDFLHNTKIDFLKLRKYAYIFSITLSVIGLISLFTRGLDPGVDFAGGRTYVIRFDQTIKTNEIRAALAIQFDGEAPEVKTFGPSSQVKVTTKYKINDEGPEVDSIIQSKLFTGLKPFYAKKDITYIDFSTDATEAGKILGIRSSQKVGPTIADDIRNKAYMAVIFALIVIFIYIAIRFKKWQYGFGGLVSLFHDALITLGIFSLLYSIMPFTMEADQTLIAAILTIIGYSINDTVIIFDRIREYVTLHPKRDYAINVNEALNSTLSRTVNTSGTTLVVLIAIFILGGEIIRGFTFALLFGIFFGTYSSVFVATPIAFDLMNRKIKKTLKIKESK
jgi:SecD/SecF fusion protein